MSYFLLYTNWMPAKFSGFTFGPLILIRPSRRGDVGLLEHEKTHVKQFYRNPLFGFAYLFSKKARLGYEAEAYREQLKYSPERREAFASALATKYNLGISIDEARAALVGAS